MLGEFLASFAERGGASTALVGVNARYVASDRVRAQVAGAGGVRLVREWRHPWLPSVVYALTRA